MKAMFTAYTHVSTLLLPELHAPGVSAGTNGTENHRPFQLQVTVVAVSVETMSHRRSNLGWAVAAPCVCHQCVMWHGCCHGEGSRFGKRVKPRRRQPASPRDTQAPCTDFEIFLVPITLWLASSLRIFLETGKGRRKALGESWRENKGYPPRRLGVRAPGTMTGWQLLSISLSCPKIIKVDYAKKERGVTSIWQFSCNETQESLSKTIAT